MRTLIIASLLLFGASLHALETPLTLTQPPQDNNNRLVTVDETSGAMRLYEIQAGTGTNALRPIAPHNFLMDLDRIRNIRLPIPNPNRQDRREDPEFVFWPLARTGSFMNNRNKPSNVPLYGEMYQYFVPQQREQVLLTEDNFFNNLPDYDGVVRAALSRSYLFITIPSSYTILVYSILDDDFELVAYRNYRPELYLVIPDQSPRGLPSFGSHPQFNAMKEALRGMAGGDILLQQRAKQMEDAVENMETEEQMIPVSESDPWIQALSRDRFVMLDPPNSKIMVYEFQNADAITLRSVRNFDLDRRIPSWPLPRRDLREFDRAVVENYLNRIRNLPERQQIETITSEVVNWGQEARRSGELEMVEVSPSEAQVILFRKIAEQQSLLLGDSGRPSKESSEPFDAVVDPGERLVLDLKTERRLLVYLLSGTGNLIELRSSRDYTIETGVAVYDYQISKRQSADQLLNQIEQLARRTGTEVEAQAMANIQYLLSIAPGSYKQLEDNRRVRRSFGEHENWQPLIEQAMADQQAQIERLQSLIELIKQEFLAREAAMQAAKERQAEQGRRR